MFIFLLIISLVSSCGSRGSEDWFLTFKSQYELDHICKEFVTSPDCNQQERYAPLPFEITSSGFSREVHEVESFLMIRPGLYKHESNVNLHGDGTHRTIRLSPSEILDGTCDVAYLVALPRFWYVDFDELRYLDFRFDSADKVINVEASSSRSRQHVIVIYSENSETLKLPVHLRYQDPTENLSGYRDTPTPNVASFAKCKDDTLYVRLYDTNTIHRYEEGLIRVPVGKASYSNLVGTITNSVVFSGAACLCVVLLLFVS